MYCIVGYEMGALWDLSCKSGMPEKCNCRRSRYPLNPFNIIWLFSIHHTQVIWVLTLYAVHLGSKFKYWICKEVIANMEIWNLNKMSVIEISHIWYILITLVMLALSWLVAPGVVTSTAYSVISGGVAGVVVALSFQWPYHWQWPSRLRIVVKCVYFSTELFIVCIWGSAS